MNHTLTPKSKLTIEAAVKITPIGTLFSSFESDPDLLSSIISTFDNASSPYSVSKAIKLIEPTAPPIWAILNPVFDTPPFKTQDLLEESGTLGAMQSLQEPSEIIIAFGFFTRHSLVTVVVVGTTYGTIGYYGTYMTG